MCQWINAGRKICRLVTRYERFRHSLCHLDTVKVVKAKPVRRCNRDTKIHTIFEGTSEIQQLVIARAISGLRIE
jgi:hypothetical protein